MALAVLTATLVVMTPLVAHAIVLISTVSVNKAGNGTGQVVSDPPSAIDCGADCSESFIFLPLFKAPSLVLIAVPDPGSTFAGWTGGGCEGTGRCTTSAAVTAIFTSLAPSPDFVITEFTAPLSGTIGGTLGTPTETSRVTVLNRGTGAGAPFRVVFEWTQRLPPRPPGSSVPVVPSIRVRSVTVCAFDQGLAAGASATCDVTVDVPAVLLGPGIGVTTELTAIVDDVDAVAEAIEINNTRALSSPVTLDVARRASTWFSIGSRGGSGAVQWGTPGDRPVPADYDGDGRLDVAVWRAIDVQNPQAPQGTWFIRRSTDGAIIAPQWGAAGDIPVPADYDGDGRADLAVWRPVQDSGEGLWFIVRSTDGGVIERQWGAATDVPVPGDYDGDGRADLAVWRPRDPSGTPEGLWFIERSSDGVGVVRQWGTAVDIPVPADYDGDGVVDVAVWRPRSGEWFVLNSRTGSATAFVFGAAGDIPVPRDYDGDGKADFAVFRPSTGEWFVRNSRDGSVTQRQWGEPGDIPVPGDYDGDHQADVIVYRP